MALTPTLINHNICRSCLLILTKKNKAVLKPNYALIAHWEAYMVILIFVANLYCWNRYNTKQSLNTNTIYYNISL